MRKRHDYWVTRAFYGKKAQHPRAPGMFAIETWQSNLSIHESEMSIFRKRVDIGSVRITDYRTDPPTITTIEVE